MVSVLSFSFFITLLLIGDPVYASYRHYHMENTDICSDNNDGKEGVLDIGTGAVILQLDNPLKIQPDYHNKIKSCQIHLKAPLHFGIMVYVEQMHLRKHSRDGSCVDYVQFGQDDIIPFITMKKSSRICGESGPTNGAQFDVQNGNMLIWLNLSGRRKTSYWPEISSVNLTLVVTAYQADCGHGAPVTHGFMNCGDHKKCIYQKYKCDKHFNCATDNGTRPADEMDCVYERELGGHGGNSSLSNDGDQSGDLGVPLNWISWSLIIVSAGLMTLLFTLLCFKLKRNRKCSSCCCCCSLSPSASCEFPDQAVIHSLADLSSQRHLRPAEQNIYLPLTTFLEQPMRDGAQPPVQQQQLQEAYLIGAEVLLETGGGSDYPEEPPPAYNELFPHTTTLELDPVHDEEFETELQNRDLETSEMLSTENRRSADVSNVDSIDNNSDDRQLSLTRRPIT